MLSLTEDTYSNELISVFLTQKNNIDISLSELLQNWNLARLAIVDKNILRLGICELLLGQIETSIIINEYIEIAKYLGSSNSYKFVNAILSNFKNKN